MVKKKTLKMKLNRSGVAANEERSQLFLAYRSQAAGERYAGALD